MKKEKIIFISFISLITLAILSPFVTLITKTTAGRIFYSSDCPGLQIVGATEQYGRENTQGTSVEVVEQKGFEFLNWSDGVTEKTRSDVFSKGKKDIRAIGKFNLSDLDLIQIVSSRKITSDQLSFTNFDKMSVSYFSNEKMVDSADGQIMIIPSYENLKGQPRRDYYFTTDKPLFDDCSSKHWQLYSMYNDKTFLHNLIAFELINSYLKPEEQRKYKFLNITFNEQYLGIYVALESNTDYYSRIGGGKVDWEISIHKVVNDQYQDLIDDNNYGYKFLQGKNKKNALSDATSQLKNAINHDVSNIDLESSKLFISILEFMKNNAATEDNIVIFKINGKLCFDPFCSYSLSSPMFKWYDYGPNNNVRLSPYLNNIKSHIDISDIVSCFLDSVDEHKDNAISIVNSCNESLLSVENTWPIVPNTIFGLPDELQFSTREQFTNYYLGWLDSRVAWLKGEKQ